MLIQYLIHWWHFASDAELAATMGGVLLLCAALSLLAERRRYRTARRGGIGWVPWTPLFLAFAMTGTGLLALSLPVVMQGR